MKNKWKYSTNTLTYNSWKAMRSRVLYRNLKIYKNISITKKWESYDNFFEDMGPRPKNTTLDRINPKGNYIKSNCRWATWQQQNRNKFLLTKIKHQNKYRTIGEICEVLNLTKQEIGKVYKRHSAYKAKTFDELFCQNLRKFRVNKRINKCKICKTKKTCKWRKEGKLCNTCYHRKKRKLI